MKRWIIFTLLLTMSLTALATAQTDDPDRDAVIEGNTAFAFDLYHALRQNNADNLIFSPHSISESLAMVYLGAGGNTATQMQQTLYFEPPGDFLATAFSRLRHDLATPVTNELVEGQPFQFNLANQMWLQQGLAWNGNYLYTLGYFFDNRVQEVDFGGNPELARETINKWVADQTEDSIQNLVPTLDASTLLMLTDAMYFKAGWRFPFDQTATQDGEFTLLDGSHVTVPLMSITVTEGFQYKRGENYRTIALPYMGDDKAMLIILPDGGHFEAIEASLNAERYHEMLNELEFLGQIKEVTLPRFKTAFETSLKPTLQTLGMTEAFTPQADFSWMVWSPDPSTPLPSIFISDVFHKAVIAVDEIGTEVATATEISIRLTNLPSEAIDFRADRSFIYAIYDQSTGTILFMGRVLNPLG